MATTNVTTPIPTDDLKSMKRSLDELISAQDGLRGLAFMLLESQSLPELEVNRLGSTLEVFADSIQGRTNHVLGVINDLEDAKYQNAKEA